jgi:anti-sigma factor RsiW
MTESAKTRDPCPEYRSRLAALLDDELTAGERETLEAHLRDCAGCRAALDRQQQAHAALSALGPSLRASPELRSAVRAQLDGAHAPVRRGPWLLSLGGVAAVVLVAAIGWAALHRQPKLGPAWTHALQAHRQETLGGAPVSYASNDRAAVIAWAKVQAGGYVAVPSYAGYTLMGARTEPSAGPHAVTLVYGGPKGRLTCLIMRGEVHLSGRVAAAPSGPAIHYVQAQGATAAGWQEKNTTYLLVANMSPPSVIQLAESAASQE